MCKYINKCRVTTSNTSISVLRENMNVQWWAERESVNVFSSPAFALFLLWQKTTESQLWLRPNFTGPTTFPFLILSVSVQMSTLLWISSPSEIQDTLPFLTWILSYGHINGNSWPPQGAVSSAVSRAEKNEVSRYDPCCWTCPLSCRQWRAFSLRRHHVHSICLRLRSSSVVMRQQLRVTIWQWSSLSSHLWLHLLHIPAKSLSITLVFSFTNSTEGHWL